MKTYRQPCTLLFETQTIESDNRLNLQRGLSFKIIFIRYGIGTRHLQHTSLTYNKGDLFIVAPGEQIHYLEVSIPTQVTTIGFTGQFITGEKLIKDWKSDLLNLLQYANQTPEYMVSLRTKADLIQQLFETIEAEINEHNNYGSEYIQQLTFTLIFLAAEKIKAILPGRINQHSDQRLTNILHYIHLNIRHPENLSTKELSHKFFISPVYLGRYFKSHTGQNLHQYILHYKLKLIENRLCNSGMRISEIADEFGFSDKSYLNKFFFKFKGISPLAYRKCNRLDSAKCHSAV